MPLEVTAASLRGEDFTRVRLSLTLLSSDLLVSPPGITRLDRERGWHTVLRDFPTACIVMLLGKPDVCFKGPGAALNLWKMRESPVITQFWLELQGCSHPTCSLGKSLPKQVVGTKNPHAFQGNLEKHLERRATAQRGMTALCGACLVCNAAGGWGRGVNCRYLKKRFTIRAEELQNKALLCQPAAWSLDTRYSLVFEDYTFLCKGHNAPWSHP